MGALGDLPADAIFFYLLAGAAAGSALGVALARQILDAAFSLLGALAAVAGLYLFLGADFLGATQLLVYVGGILVLILFAILLTQRIGEVNAAQASRGLRLGLPAAIALSALLARAALSTRWPEATPVAAPMTRRLGDALLGEYLLPFELLSLVLLAALVGAMAVGRRAARASMPVGAESSEAR